MCVGEFSAPIVSIPFVYASPLSFGSIDSILPPLDLRLSLAFFFSLCFSNCRACDEIRMKCSIVAIKPHASAKNVCVIKFECMYVCIHFQFGAGYVGCVALGRILIFLM